MDAFFEGVYRLVALVPCGKVTTYGQIARLLGCPRASRQVGRAMRLCPDALPWQRVVKADGTVAGGDFATHRRGMLEAEGVPFLPDGRVDVAKCLWKPEPAATDRLNENR